MSTGSNVSVVAEMTTPCPNCSYDTLPGNVTNDMPYHHTYEIGTTWHILIPLYGIIFILSVMGNALVILTLIQNKRMRTVTNAFLLNLSISDLLLAVFCMPFTIVPMMLRNFIFGEVTCYLIRYLQGVSVCVSCFTLVAISLERYFAICRPLHSRKWQTLSHSYKAIGVCWFLGLVLMIPIPVFTEHYKLPAGNFRCVERWDSLQWEQAYTVLIDLILLVNPLLMMSVAYGLISMTLWVGMRRDAQGEQEASGSYKDETTTFIKDDDASPISETFNGKSVMPSMANVMFRPAAKSSRRYDLQRGIRQTNSEKSRAAKRRVIKMLFVVVYEFFLFWTPLYVVQSWISLDYESAARHLDAEIMSFIYLIAYISACCNPITYCFMNRNFRQGFLSVFRCLRPRKKFQRRKSECISYSSQFPIVSRTLVSSIATVDKHLSNRLMATEQSTTSSS